MTKRRLWIAAGVVIVFAGIAIVAFLRFPLGAVEEPGRFETWAAARAKHLLIERASRSGIPGSPTDRQSSLVEGDKVFGVDCAACHGMGAPADGRRPLDVPARGGFELEGRAELFRSGIVLDHQEWDPIERHAGFCKC